VNPPLIREGTLHPLLKGEGWGEVFVLLKEKPKTPPQSSLQDEPRLRKKDVRAEILRHSYSENQSSPVSLVWPSQARNLRSYCRKRIQKVPSRHFLFAYLLAFDIFYQKNEGIWRKRL